MTTELDNLNSQYEPYQEKRADLEKKITKQKQMLTAKVNNIRLSLIHKFE